MLNIQAFVFNPFRENSYVIWDAAGVAALIDPGCSNAEEEGQLKSFIDERKLHVEHLLNTHCHVDHVLGNRFVKETWQVDLAIPEHEDAVLRSAEVLAPAYGFHHYRHQDPDLRLKDGDIIRVGELALKVLAAPGHSPGHVAFYDETSGTVLGGDVLFYNSVGRTDLPGGDYDTLMNSIHTRLFTLPDGVTVYPGHGPKTTIGFEKKTNPFCSVEKYRD